ncbi:hypothetical protein ACFQU1_21730 [Chelatococcus sp. GCM10030263]|uniref:hypothetical protein n=1 Tax=Chelatococcus sp. GCM10030263 TaxID=3273387 RepID=UPI003620B872
MADRKKLAGFAAQRSGTGLVIHIIDDAGEVFEIEATRENVELIVQNLEVALAGGSAEDAHSKG